MPAGKPSDVTGPTPEDWRDLLLRWNGELLTSTPIDARVPEAAVRSGWLGLPAATEEQIAHAEARLGTTLPPSYRAFLRVSNGWPHTGTLVGRIYRVEEIGWFGERHRDWIDAWMSGAESQGPNPPVPDEKYFVYGKAQNTVHMRPEYLDGALEVSEAFDGGIYLLNPQVVTPAGEWEAWFFANWLPGAIRHRTFWDMMTHEHEMFLQLRAMRGV